MAEEVAAERARMTELLPLTDRQREILELVSDGLNHTEIAALLGLAHKTIDNLMSVAMDRLGARNRAHAVKLGIRWGLIDPDGGSITPGQSVGLYASRNKQSALLPRPRLENPITMRACDRLFICERFLREMEAGTYLDLVSPLCTCGHAWRDHMADGTCGWETCSCREYRRLE